MTILPAPANETGRRGKRMKNRLHSIRALAAVLAVAALSGACFRPPVRVPTGSWNYTLLLNGSEAGSAVISNELRDGCYRSTMELTMRAGSVTNVSWQEVVETADFRPVRLTTRNRIITPASVQEINTTAEFSGRTVRLDTGDQRSEITLQRDVVLDGNYFLSSLIDREFAEGSHVEAYVYDPSIEMDGPILLKSRVGGRTLVNVGGETFTAIRLNHSIENVKNMESYIDSDGVLLKAVIVMLNMHIELVRR